ncbi:MAG: hypothetical protein ACTSUO_08470 [Candidatus Thorarchaeota archaeon]
MSLKIIIVLVTVLFFAVSCSVLQSDFDSSNPPQPPTPEKQLYQAVKKSNWLVTASIIGIAIGVFTVMNGMPKLGLASIAAASTSLFMALAVARYATWMAVFGLVGSILAAISSVLVRRRALIEIIKGVQEIKQEFMDEKSKDVNKVLASNQSKSTQRVVQNIKGALKLKGSI